jgi:hypothetical protein
VPVTAAAAQHEGVRVTSTTGSRSMPEAGRQRRTAAGADEMGGGGQQEGTAATTRITDERRGPDAGRPSRARATSNAAAARREYAAAVPVAASRATRGAAEGARVGRIVGVGPCASSKATG